MFQRHFENTRGSPLAPSPKSTYVGHAFHCGGRAMKNGQRVIRFHSIRKGRVAINLASVLFWGGPFLVPLVSIEVL